MGMFDSVFATCPTCDKEIEFQSKAGECRLKRYSINSVPPEIAVDISGHTETCECGYILRINWAQPRERVQMIIQDGGSKWD